MKKIKINFLVIFLLFQITSFGQNEEVINKKWSLGINYMNIKYTPKNYNYFGLSFEHKIYKRFFINTGIEYNRRKKHYEVDDSTSWFWNDITPSTASLQLAVCSKYPIQSLMFYKNGCKFYLKNLLYICKYNNYNESQL